MSRSRPSARVRVATLLGAVGLGLPLVLVGTPAEAASAARPYDFDGDGHPDLVVGAPGLRVGSTRDAGGVVVLPASAAGLSLKETVLTQSTKGVPGRSERYDGFGTAVASADFDRDGYADLAVGAPGEKLGSQPEAGAVTVVYGSKKGLRAASAVQVVQPGGATSFAGFGAALAAADLDGDGYPDLAVGAPGDEPGPLVDEARASGTVHVLAGGRRGLGRTDLTVLHRRGGAPDDFDFRFGARLATGDLDGDGRADLVVGSTGQQYDEGGYPGSISACLGGAAGPTTCARLAHGDGLAGLSAVAVANVSGSPAPEVVGSGVSEAGGRGSVTVLSLGSGARTVTRTQTITQDSPGVPGDGDQSNDFGAGLATGDLDRDGYADLVVGAPGTAERRGQVVVIHGGAGGYRTTGSQVLSQDTPGVPGRAQQDDAFGAAVTLLDHDDDGRLDLTVGAPGENVSVDDLGGIRFVGAVTTLKGSGAGFTATGSRTFGLPKLGYRHPYDSGFGAVLGS